MKEPIEFLQDMIKSKRIDAFLVTDLHNVHYLTGFSGSSGFCLITKNKNLFFTDFRYTEQAEQEVTGWSLEAERGRRIDTIKRYLKKLSIKKLAFETSISYSFYHLLQKTNTTLSPVTNIVEDMRQSKNSQEINYIVEAFNRAEEAFLDIKRFVKKGIKESEIALRLENAIKQKGSKRLPFDIIVASGHNSSKPHATVTEKKIQRGDLVTIDWGAEFNGYYSDITRTILIKGHDMEEKIKIYNIVNEARALAIKGVKVGERAKDIDNIARRFIEKSGFGKYFGHGLGHGIGLQAHEEPRINKISKALLKNGMVFTIEPGIYIRELGGVRIEDTVAIYDNKPKVLNKLTTELEIVD